MEIQTPLLALSRKEEVRRFVDEEIIPMAREFDESQSIPRSFLKKMADHGFMGIQIPKAYGGSEINNSRLGIIHEEIGRGYSSIQNFLTVVGMVCKPLSKFGTPEQKEKWLPLIASGDIIPAIAITEPNVGSDIKVIENIATCEGDCYMLNGKKKYITLGQIADVFLVAARCERRGVVFLVERNTPGLTIKPIKNLLGLKANMLAELHFDNCLVPAKNMVGNVGYGLTHVISFALNEGRYTTACGCVGLGQACLESAMEYANSRKQFQVLLKEHQLVKKMLTEIIIHVKASRELCYSAGIARDNGDPSAVNDTLIAKYFASKMATLVSNHAVQIHGAFGCTDESPVQRFFRDSKIMEIIEGASQMYELHIPTSYLN